MGAAVIPLAIAAASAGAQYYNTRQTAKKQDNQLADQAKKRMALNTTGKMNPNSNGIGSVIASLLGRNSGL